MLRRPERLSAFMRFSLCVTGNMNSIAVSVTIPDFRHHIWAYFATLLIYNAEIIGLLIYDVEIMGLFMSEVCHLQLFVWHY